MKEIMKEIELRFMEALIYKTDWSNLEVIDLYKKISSEVYLEKLSELMERRH